ncbi:hypothetical protein V499_03666 [Pseudogymnoascus sp. VKM F-103]|nr:hypothetical protein V499_03666 [Pseudogymnoascus sp. VKM F-103]
MARTNRNTASIGLTTLHEPEDALIDIVFIHGFNGHPERTWTYKRADADPPNHSNNPELPERPSKFRKLNPFSKDQERNSCHPKETYWPRDLLPHTVKKARVLTFGYDTTVHHRFGQTRNRNTIYDFAWEFLNCLSDSRRSDGQSRRPLLFVAHSLGGIITKEALRQANLKSAHESCAHLRNIFLSTSSIIFFGTPHRGADPRGFLQHVAERAARAAGFTVNQKVFDTLLPDSERLKELLDEFPLLVSKMKWNIVSFREMYGMAVLGGKKVVDDASSCLGDFNLEIVRDIESDHRDMCRFSGLNDPRYEKVAAAIHRLVQPLLGENKEMCVEEPRPGPRASTHELRTTGPTTPGTTTPEAKDDGKILSEAQQKEMMDRLRFKQMDARLLTLKTAQAKTCRWLLKNGHYKDWINTTKISEHHGFFWIKGKPGTGKSIMMKFLFWEAKKSMKGSIVMSFFFNARGGDLEKSTTGLYRSLLLQLLEKAPETRHILDYYGTSGFNAIKETSDWPDEMLKEAFTRALEKLGEQRIVCYIDALDECPEDDVRDMISFFEGLGDLEKAVEFRVCFSSRHYPEISIRTGLQLVLELEQDHKNDITLYIDTHLKIGTTTQAEDIKAQILEKSSNIFLWVALVIPILNKEYDRGRIKALKKRLGEIPAGLHELFLDILTRDHKNIGELLVCIRAILFAARPFRPDELRIAVEAGNEDDPPDGPCDPAQMTADNLRRFVFDASKGLAEITKSKEPTVQFIHESVRDFLLKDGGLQKLLPTVKNFEGQGHDTLKRICSLQLSLYTARLALFTERVTVSGESLFSPDWAQEYPLLQYAVDHIYFHANWAQNQGLDQTVFLETFNTPAWVRARNVSHKTLVPSETWHNCPHLLYFLGEYGCADLIRNHPERHKIFQLDGGPFSHPILPALYAGHSAAARAFVNLPQLHDETSANPAQPKSRRSFTMKKGGFNKKRHIISFLCEFGDVDILRVVLESSLPRAKQNLGVMLSSGDTMWECLQYASSEAIVDVLMEFSTAYIGITEIIGHKKPLNLLNNGEELTLSKFPHLELVLKKHPPLINQAGFWGDSTHLLSYAAERGFEHISKLCIKDASDYNIQDALFYAVRGRINHSSRLAVIGILLDARVDRRTAQQSGLDELIFDAMMQTHNEEVVALLLSTSCLDLEFKWQGLTPLLWAIQESRKTFVKMLLEAGSDPMARTPDGTTALTLAVKLSDLSSFRCMLSNPKCDIDARDDNGRTSLSWCATVADRTAITMISDLIKLPSVDPNSRDRSGQTVLTRAVRSGNPELVKMLLCLPTVDPDLPSSRGLTPLMLAFKLSLDYGCSRVFWEISRLLLLTGKVDVDRYDRRPIFRPPNIYGPVNLVSLVECFYRCLERGQLDELRGLEWPGKELS